jgi:hypothetical protein
VRPTIKGSDNQNVEEDTGNPIVEADDDLLEDVTPTLPALNVARQDTGVHSNSNDSDYGDDNDK